MIQRRACVCPRLICPSDFDQIKFRGIALRVPIYGARAFSAFLHSFAFRGHTGKPIFLVNLCSSAFRKHSLFNNDKLAWTRKKGKNPLKKDRAMNSTGD